MSIGGRNDAFCAVTGSSCHVEWLEASLAWTLPVRPAQRLKRNNFFLQPHSCLTHEGRLSTKMPLGFAGFQGVDVACKLT